MLCSLFFTTPTTYQMVSSNYQRECDLTERKKNMEGPKGNGLLTLITPRKGIQTCLSLVQFIKTTYSVFKKIRKLVQPS
jgi:hypothetical protein